MRMPGHLYRTEGEITYLPFYDNSGQLIAEGMIDTSDLPMLLSCSVWRLSKGGHIVVSGEVYLQRYLLGTAKKSKTKFSNGNTLDCRRSNLISTDKNPVVVKGSVTEVLLCDLHGNPIRPTLIDSDDAERVLDVGRWYITRGTGSKEYVLCDARATKSKVKLHRFIIDAPDGMQVDHINGNTLDNRKSNLRICTNFVNQQNRSSINSNNMASGKRNVYWHQSGRWQVKVVANGKIYAGGYFDTVEQAEAKAIQMRRELHPTSPIRSK